VSTGTGNGSSNNGDANGNGNGESSETDPRTADGRVPGRRGLLTRAKLLEKTRSLLETSSYRDLKVVDIARGAGTSPATFYQYFPDAEAAMLALADELVGEGRERLTRPVREGDWSSKEAYRACEDVAASFLSFWSDHGPLMRVIDLAALEGDQRFRDIRTGMLNAFSEAIGHVVDEQRAAGRLPSDLETTATSAVLVAMLAHVAGHQYGIEHYGTTPEALQRAMARQLYSGVTGRKPPA